MIAELTNHVWQSTIFAIAAGLIALALRRNRAQVRYWLWLSGSVKFLLPFSILMAIGRRLEWASRIPSVVSTPTVRLAVVEFSAPFSGASTQAALMRPGHDWVAIGILGLWACGFLGLIVLRLRGWFRVRDAVRFSVPIDFIGTMQVRSSPGLLEPGVVGLFHPILLLPAGIEKRLQQPQLKAVLAHELTHARRLDNLTSAIHMIVETVFWFHPLVWWIGARLMEERELACDEAVLSLGNAPLDYAEGILTVCKSYLESPLSLVSGVTGANLKKRIQAILTGHIAGDLNFAKKIVLAAAAIVALANSRRSRHHHARSRHFGPRAASRSPLRDGIDSIVRRLPQSQAGRAFPRDVRIAMYNGGTAHRASLRSIRKWPHESRFVSGSCRRPRLDSF